MGHGERLRLRAASLWAACAASAAVKRWLTFSIALGGLLPLLIPFLAAFFSGRNLPSVDEVIGKGQPFMVVIVWCGTALGETEGELRGRANRGNGALLLFAALTYGFAAQGSGRNTVWVEILGVFWMVMAGVVTTVLVYNKKSRQDGGVA